MPLSLFKVIFHYEVNGRPLQQHGWRQSHVAAASGDPAILAAVLASNGLGAPSGATLVFDSIANSGIGSYLS